MIGKCKAIAHGSTALDYISERESSAIGLPSTIFAAGNQRQSMRK